MGMTSCQCYSIPSQCTYFQGKDDTFSEGLNAGKNSGDCGMWDQVTASVQTDAPTTSDVLLHHKEYEDDTEYDAASSDSSAEKKVKQNERYFEHSYNRQKGPQLVAKRNLRERNRVQAVNGAFNRLRKAVPFQHARGKRISKVKTLQNAINYIRGLEQLLNNELFQTISMRGYYNPKQDSIWWDLEY
ncbi:achaete-scute homolog 1a-like [Harmonia axyridis]|uniref:achaete-scute homolog 1a-like n=1 Tax=Harmonia axyridis TaxID=115357 RepID=UPI001E276DF1|nr:achaete-scute homolog 1a-like [Harmonia axyridis]